MDSLDTSLLVRYYTDDHAVQRAQVVNLLKAGGPLFVSVTVVLETVWVLERVYRVPRARIVKILRHLMALDPVRVETEPVVSAAVDTYAGGLDFAGALHLARSAACQRFLSFDRGRVRRAGRLNLVPRCEPPGADA